MKEEYIFEEWNKEIIPKIQDGTFKDISEELPDSFLLVNQVMRGRIIDNKGVKWDCSGWSRNNIIKINCSKVEAQ